MAYLKKERVEEKDFRNRFEFILTTSNASGQENIIIKRCFKIDNFNPLCTRSSRLTDAVVRCAKLINKDLTEKSAIYTEYAAPRVFESVKEMKEYFEVPSHNEGMVPGEALVIRDEGTPNYVYHKNGPKLAPGKFNKYEFTHELTADDVVTFKLTILDHATFKWIEDEAKVDPRTGKLETSYNDAGTVFREVVDNEIGNEEGRVICSYSWTNILPKIVRNMIDIENKRANVTNKDTLAMGGDDAILYKMCAGRTSLGYRIIRELCHTCSGTNERWYRKADPFGEETLIG